MQAMDYVVQLILSVIMIVGVYQFYFFTQRHPLREAKKYHSKLDEKIPFLSSWSWIYSFIYYPAILYLNWVVTDARQFLMIAFTFICLLLMQMTCFFLYPVAVPDHWRTQVTGKNLSERFLLFVQKFDAPSNCFPSMHVSVATLTAFFAFPTLGYWVILFPVLIALSCMFTKQHYVIDLPFGALLGTIAYSIYAFILI